MLNTFEPTMARVSHDGQVFWTRPGTLAKAPLNASCIPRAEADGVRVSLEWQPPQNLGATEDAHFVLAVLSKHEEVTLLKADDEVPADASWIDRSRSMPRSINSAILASRAV